MDNTALTGDLYFKIRPVFESVRRKCLEIEEEKRFPVAEMMIPCKGTKAGSRRQYMQKIPKKWRFNMFVRCGVSGLMYDFSLKEVMISLGTLNFLPQKKNLD